MGFLIKNNNNFIRSFSIQKEVLEEKNWNKLWEESREVIKVTDKIVIKPSFKEYKAEAGKIVLTIDPKMSFGTGEHATTQLVLKLLEEYIKPGMNVLDVGSGTGVLAIAAVKLGAAKATAVDNDDLCYQNCMENCELNSVSDKVKVLYGNIKTVQEDNFNLILANIQKNVLIEIAGDITKKLCSGGILILSGLLRDDEEEIMQKYSSLGFKFLKS